MKKVLLVLLAVTLFNCEKDEAASPEGFVCGELTPQEGFKIYGSNLATWNRITYFSGHTPFEPIENPGDFIRRWYIRIDKNWVQTTRDRYHEVNSLINSNNITFYDYLCVEQSLERCTNCPVNAPAD